MNRRRNGERTTARARKVVERMQTPRRETVKPPKAAPEVAAPPAAVFAAPAISPRIYIRAGHLAGRLEAVFESEGAVALAKEDEAREWLHGSPIAQSIVGELLTTAGFLDEYQAWASLD